MMNSNEINMAEIARQQYDLDQANATLEAERSKLSEAEKQMLAQQQKRKQNLT